jgi:hypothetical protein
MASKPGVLPKLPYGRYNPFKPSGSDVANYFAKLHFLPTLIERCGGENQ